MVNYIQKRIVSITLEINKLSLEKRKESNKRNTKGPSPESGKDLKTYKNTMDLFPERWKDMI